jgi:hypothetical protein
MMKFRIICLKRSQFKDSNDFEYTTDWYKSSKIVYWREDRAGYTSDIEQAGEYTIQELNQCAGKWMDWILEPAWE